MRDGGGWKSAAGHLGPMLQLLGAGSKALGRRRQWHYVYSHPSAQEPGPWSWPALVSALGQPSCTELPPFAPAAPACLAAAAGTEDGATFCLSP